MSQNEKIEEKRKSVGKIRNMFFLGGALKREKKAEKD